MHGKGNGRRLRRLQREQERRAALLRLRARLVEVEVRKGATS